MQFIGAKLKGKTMFSHRDTEGFIFYVFGFFVDSLTTGTVSAHALKAACCRMFLFNKLLEQANV